MREKEKARGKLLTFGILGEEYIGILCTHLATFL